MKKIFLILIFLFYTNVYSNIIDLNYLKNKYSTDVVGYLYIEDVVSTPIVKTTDNKFYLNHDIYGNYDIKGTIFMDYRSNNNKIIIYGHNSNIYDVPFKNLEKYLDDDFLNNHRIIDLYIEDDNNKFYINEVYISKDKYTFEYVMNNYDLVLQTCYENGYLLISSTRYD